MAQTKKSCNDRDKMSNICERLVCCYSHMNVSEGHISYPPKDKTKKLSTSQRLVGIDRSPIILNVPESSCSKEMKTET